MKKILKPASLCIFVLVLIAISVTQFFAETIFYANGFSYTVLSDDYASICNWDGTSDTMEIPAKLNNSRVKEIAGWAFNERKDIYGVNFEKADYLEKIGSMAFKNCTGIQGELTISAKVSKIGLGAFQGCSSIETLYYNTTAAIPDQAFYMCSGLKTAVLGDGVKSIGSLSFAECSNLEFVRIPDSVTSINEYAFIDSPKVVIYCYSDSYAEQFAKENNIEFELLDPILGDANFDGSVDVRDVTAIQKYKAGLTKLTRTGIRAADVTGDGEVSVRDATQIQRYLANIITDF